MNGTNLGQELDLRAAPSLGTAVYWILLCRRRRPGTLHDCYVRMRRMWSTAGSWQLLERGHLGMGRSSVVTVRSPAASPFSAPACDTQRKAGNEELRTGKDNPLWTDVRLYRSLCFSESAPKVYSSLGTRCIIGFNFYIDH